MDIILEIIAVVLGFLYLIFLIKEQKICWFFGIAGSVVSVYLFYRTQLYSEAILYVYYVVIGVYGYLLWNNKIDKNGELKVEGFKPKRIIYAIFIGLIFAYILGIFFKTYTDASAPYLDAFTTSFSFIASYLEAKKYLSSWLFWIVINALTIVLYYNKDLNIYTGLTLVYLIFSFIGYLKWKKSMNLQLGQ